VTKYQLKGYSTYWATNNILHHCKPGKDWYIHAITLYTKQDLKYKYRSRICSLFILCAVFQMLI